MLGHIKIDVTHKRVIKGILYVTGQRRGHLNKVGQPKIK